MRTPTFIGVYLVIEFLNLLRVVTKLEKLDHLKICTERKFWLCLFVTLKYIHTYVECCANFFLGYLPPNFLKSLCNFWKYTDYFRSPFPHPTPPWSLKLIYALFAQFEERAKTNAILNHAIIFDVILRLLRCLHLH